MNVDLAPFPSYLAKRAEVDAAWSRCEQHFASLESPLRELAERFFLAVSRGASSHRSYFSNPLAPPLLYMPLWLRDGLAKRGRPVPSDDAMIELLAGTMQGYFYIRIQDDVLDDSKRADAELLLLGNACLSFMISAYTEALGGGVAPFWQAFGRAFADFSRLTLVEQRAVVDDAPYPTESFVAHADKVAFARVPLLAVALLADAPELEANIRALVHHLGVAYGLTNDALGWPRDVDAGHRTYMLAEAGIEHAELLTLARAEPGAEREARAEALVERIRGSLYEGGILRRTLATATTFHHRAEGEAQALGMEGFGAFTQERIAWIEAFEREISLLTLRRVMSRSSG